MCFSIEQLDRACGLLLLNEFNIFVYCCKNCQLEFDSGSSLEVHVLEQHQDNKQNIIVDDQIFVDSLSCDQTSIKEDNYDEDIPIAECMLYSDSSGEDKEDSKEVEMITASKRSVDRSIRSKVESENSGNEIEFTKPQKMTIKLRLSSSKRNHSSNRTNTETVKKKKTQKARNLPNVMYCEMCPNLHFDGKASLMKHMKGTHIPPPKERQVCEKCGVHPRNYENHMKTNHSEQPMFKCDFESCNAKFKGKHNLIIHRRNHTGERPWLCVNCGMSFTSQAAWRKHDLHIHKQFRKFQCTQCERSFVKKSRLRDHINGVHTKER